MAEQNGEKQLKSSSHQAFLDSAHLGSLTSLSSAKSVISALSVKSDSGLEAKAKRQDQNPKIPKSQNHSGVGRTTGLCKTRRSGATGSLRPSCEMATRKMRGRGKG